MQKSTILAICFLFSVLCASAQIRINPKIGLTISSLDTESELLKDPKKGRIAGTFGIDVRTNSKGFFIQPGVHYARTSLITYDVRDTTITPKEDKIYVNSIKVPLNVGTYLTGEGGVLKVRIDAGVIGNFPIGVSKNDIGFTTEFYNSPEFGLNGGVGIEVLFFTLDIRYEKGLNTYFKKELDKGKNQVISFQLGVVF